MSWNKKDTIKIITIDIRADKLIQLVIKIIGKKIVAHTKVKLKLYANKTPAIVATAFPPLNFKNMENVWPKIANKPVISKTKFTTWIWHSLNIFTANHPLKTSANNTAIPALGPKIRNVFVVPIFPDPKFLISFLKNIRPTISPLGNEPNKYAKINNIILELNTDIMLSSTSIKHKTILSKFIKLSKLCRINWVWFEMEEKLFD